MIIMILTWKSKKKIETKSKKIISVPNRYVGAYRMLVRYGTAIIRSGVGMGTVYWYSNPC